MTAPQPWRLRVASYNIRKAVGLDWRRRPERILHVLDEVGADVAVLQEADQRLGRQRAAIPHLLLEAHGRFRHLDPGPGPSLGWRGNAVLLGPGIEGRVLDRLALPGLEARGALVARVGPAGGPEAVTLVAAHLALHPASRHRQMAAIVAAVLADGPGRRPVVLAGDLNERAPARLVAPLGHDLRLVTPGPSFHAAHPFMALDHFVLEGAVRAVASGVHASPLSRVASDHLPIWADLEVGGA